MPPETLQHKSLKVSLKADAEGSFRAVFASFNEVDHDGDVTVPGAFPEGKEVLVSAYMHGSWMGALPVGKGVIGQDDKEAWVDGSFFLDTIDGLNTYRTVKAVAGLQEWSYGYDILRSSTDKADLEPFPGAVQMLQEVDPYEVSPVLLGAGIGTHTDFIKSRLTPPWEQGEDVSPEAIAEFLGAVTYAKALDLVVASAKAVTGRSRDRAEYRASDRERKEGRTLSGANRERLSALADALQVACGDIQELLASTDPEAGKAADWNDELLAIYAENERRRLALA